MTTDHRATPEQWALVIDRSQRAFSEDSCVLELLHRIQALELALRALAGSLTESEQASLGVMSGSAMKAAARRGVDLALREFRKRPGDKAEPAALFVNINDDVSVRLTDYGRSVIPRVDLMYMETGTDGWTRIQMHHFMRIFGPRSWDQENIFEKNEIRIHP